MNRSQATWELLEPVAPSWGTAVASGSTSSRRGSLEAGSPGPRKQEPSVTWSWRANADLLLEFADQRLVGRGQAAAIAQGPEASPAVKEPGAGLLSAAQRLLQQAEPLAAHDEADLGLHVVGVRFGQLAGQFQAPGVMGAGRLGVAEQLD